ncbi:MAG: DNA-directed RNA polymerase subunit alpha [Chloroflexi bacterium RBG_13_53_26]|nr:MAG: DNA-directed RNA polymerase subunit alpha [Chloroflexi bacterium RBG_13_53_26]
MSHLVTPRVECVESTGDYGRFVAEPLERGFGITLGNALRRVLLSSLLGAAVAWVRIDGIDHEFSTIPDVKEDVTEFLLNIKAIRLRSTSKNEGKLRLEVEGERVVHAGDIQPSADFEVVNPELHLATLDSPEAKLYVELNVKLGKGYIPASTHGDGLPIGTIPVDSIFTPVRKVNYVVEPVHTGEYSGYEKLVLDIWTDGTVPVLEALSQSAQILREQLSFFTSLVLAPMVETEQAIGGVSIEQYEMPLEQLGLSPRVFNCLRRNKISKVGELLEKSEKDLLSLKKFGRKSVEELQEQLEEMGLSLRSEKDDEA